MHPMNYVYYYQLMCRLFYRLHWPALEFLFQKSKIYQLVYDRHFMLNYEILFIMVWSGF